MPTPFLSSEEYDERAHQLYNDGRYDDALAILTEGIGLYPNAVELHVGVGYARLAREEYAWAKHSFEEALVLDPEYEDALAGLGEVLLRFGQGAAALRSFRRILELGYQDDVELMLQCGRALFRDGLIEDAEEFFQIGVRHANESAEAVALVGYCEHRRGDDDAAVATLKRALQLDGEHAEARIYLGNILYDRGDYELALYHLDRTRPEEHWDELGIWRLVELKKTIYRLQDDDPEIRVWEERLGELSAESDDIGEMLAEIETRAQERADLDSRNQLELFGALLGDLEKTRNEGKGHLVVMAEGSEFAGSWEDIVRGMRNSFAADVPHPRSVREFMLNAARREYARTGILLSTSDAESFLRCSADAGLLRILR
jgi:Tfp pilus assembly protein PilF